MLPGGDGGPIHLFQPRGVFMAAVTALGVVTAIITG